MARKPIGGSGSSTENIGQKAIEGDSSQSDSYKLEIRPEERIVGISQATQDLVQRAKVAAKSDLPVLLIGPPGSDRLGIGLAIHECGPRAPFKFEHLPCFSIPESLQRREIFGCARGVYPAVPNEYSGAIERAGTGSLFLDRSEALDSRIRELITCAVDAQSYTREGNNTAIPITTRIIATIDSDSSDTFMDGIPHHRIRVMSLRDRPTDILYLAKYYLSLFSTQSGVKSPGLSHGAKAALTAETWKGDVAELRERIKVALQLSGGEMIQAETLMLASDGEDIPSFKDAKRAFESRYVVGLLRRCNGNISRAARLAKKDRKDFYDVIRRTGVNPSEFRISRSEKRDSRKG